jgi:hypothetical protein
MRWIAASPRAKHSLCGTVKSPSRSHRRTATQREGRGGGGGESRCDCGEESEFSESHWKTLLILYGAGVQHSLSSGKRVRFEGCDRWARTRQGRRSQFGAGSLDVEAAALALSHMLPLGGALPLDKHLFITKKVVTARNPTRLSRLSSVNFL